MSEIRMPGPWGGMSFLAAALLLAGIPATSAPAGDGIHLEVLPAASQQEDAVEILWSGADPVGHLLASGNPTQVTRPGSAPQTLARVAMERLLAGPRAVRAPLLPGPRLDLRGRCLRVRGDLPEMSRGLPGGVRQ